MPANELINLYYEGILETSRNNTYFPVVRKQWMCHPVCKDSYLLSLQSYEPKKEEGNIGDRAKKLGYEFKTYQVKLETILRLIPRSRHILQ